VDTNPPANAGWYPMWQLAPIDGSEAALALAKTETVRRKYMPDMIKGKPADFEKTWNEYIKEMDKANLAKYVEFMQEGLDERVREFGGLPE
jgi:putative aldouronate transport system substrate-binding protein